MIWYGYNQITKEFTNELEGIPERLYYSATTKKPPVIKENQKIIFDEKKDKWQILSLKEYTQYLIDIGQKKIEPNQKISETGEIVPKTEKELIQDGLITIDSLKQNKINEVNSNARKLIVSGFYSSVLGESHLYPSDEHDQMNLIGLVSSGIDSIFKCKKNISDNWEYKNHTKAQLKQLLQDGANYKKTILVIANERKNEINNCKTYEELEKISTIIDLNEL